MIFRVLKVDVGDLTIESQKRVSYKKVYPAKPKSSDTIFQLH